MRKRLFWEECMDGPFEVCGQEQRRVIGAHARNQTHSCPSTGKANFETKTAPVGRRLSGCAICARSMWLEDLYEMDLFTKPDSRQGEEDDDDADVTQTQAQLPRRCRFKVHQRCVSKVNRLLSAEAYGRRWPLYKKIW